MADTATTRMGLRKQSLGSNVNTWGDTKLNDGLDIIDRATKGYESVTMTGDTTLTWTSYATTNQGQVQTLKLAGSLSAAANLVIPSREWSFTAINATGQTVTVKTAAGSGVAIATGYQAALYCDATDVINATSRYAGGRIGNVTAATETTDAVNKAQMDAAIAAATTSSTAGTVKITSTDTTAKFLATAVTTSITGYLTLQIGTIYPSSNEQLQFTGRVRKLTAARVTCIA